MPVLVFSVSANLTSAVAWFTRDRFEAPWPSPVLASAPVPEPFDLKWLTIARKLLPASPTNWNAWASGWRAFTNAASSKMVDPPTVSTAAVL